MSELKEILRRKLTVRQAEWHRREGKERAKKREALISNPFSFTKRLLGQKKSGILSYPIEEINHHLNITFSEPLREQELGPYKAFIKPPEPMVQFNTSKPTLKEVKEAMMAAKSSSFPESHTRSTNSAKDFLCDSGKSSRSGEEKGSLPSGGL